MILGSGLIQASGKTRLTLYTTKSGTFNPTIVASDTSGIVWDFGDGSATYTGGTPSHSYADGTQKTVTITFDDPTLVTQLNFVNFSLVGGLPIMALAPFENCVTFAFGANAGLNISGDVADIPRKASVFSPYNTASTFGGDISDFPTTLTQLYLTTAPVTLTGALSGLGALVNTVDIRSGSSSIVAGSGALACVGMRVLVLQNCVKTEMAVDGILERLYLDRASFTWATPTLNIAGTNPNPTGTYADATPPTTGLEYAYKLVNDPDTEGFNTWTVTY